MDGERDDVTFEDLYNPGDIFQSLDCKLCVAVDNLVKDHANLRNDIMLRTEALAKEGKMIAGRQVLKMVNPYFRTDVENGSVYDIEDIIAVHLHGNNMENFLQRWDRVLLGTRLHGRPLFFKFR